MDMGGQTEREAIRSGAPMHKKSTGLPPLWLFFPLFSPAPATLLWLTCRDSVLLLNEHILFSTTNEINLIPKRGWR